MRKRVTKDIGIYLLPSSKVETDMSYCNVKKKIALLKKKSKARRPRTLWAPYSGPTPVSTQNDHNISIHPNWDRMSLSENGVLYIPQVELFNASTEIYIMMRLYGLYVSGIFGQNTHYKDRHFLTLKKRIDNSI